MTESVPGDVSGLSKSAVSSLGLSERDAQERLARDGPNEIASASQSGALKLAAEVASEPMFMLLVACGIVYWVLGDRQEAWMLLAFVIIVMLTSFVQQRRSEKALLALRDMSSPRAQVERDATMRMIAARDVVVGDLVYLAEGDRVPADLELVVCSGLTVDESLLTGESVPVGKQCADSVDADARVFAGTLVTSGSARGKVVATAQRSALGKIGQSLASIVVPTTPVQQETRRVIKGVAIVGLLLAAGLALALGITQGNWLRGVLAGLTLAMAVLPEELPAVLTLFLGLGAWRLARENVLARSVPAVELLGATTVLCVDKTGTITANRMIVRMLWSTETAFDTSAPLISLPLALPDTLHRLLEYAWLASHRRAFDPMETAIGQASQQLLIGTEHLHEDWALVEDFALSPDMLAMSRVWRSPEHAQLQIASKGAPEAIVDLCHLGGAERARVIAQVEAMAAGGLRVLGVAMATVPPADLPDEQHGFDFVFLGLIALEDPVRPEVPEAIAQCQAAGIRVVMITGDHPATAVAIARQAGVLTDAPAITGSQLATLSDGSLAQRLGQTSIFCRVQPEQKLRLVRAFQARGEVVAMTGDGVNDAPALKAADIGVAMGARGTQVAREAAALVLLDDNFLSLVTAVRYGRRVFANLRKAITFVVAVHVPIVGLSLVPVLFGWPMLLMPVHILFLQLVIDPACSIVFEAEPLESRAMQTPPRRADQRLFDRAVLARGLWQGVGLLALLLVVYAGSRAYLPQSPERENIARALTFLVLVLSNLGLIHANRSWERSSLRGSAESGAQFAWIVAGTLVLLATVFGIPAIGRLFAFSAPSVELLLIGFALAGVSLLWFELVKRVLRVPDLHA